MPGAEKTPSRRSWGDKFADAFRGLREGTRGQSSFRIHFLFTMAVVIAAIILRSSITEWGLLALCITIVLTAELFNTALERLAKAVDDQPNSHIGAALDISAAAVLLASLGAAAVGFLVFIYRLGVLMAWWPESG